MMAAEDEPKSSNSDNNWMVRPCELYYDEYADCKSFRGRFNRYYQFGDKEDCSQWKTDHDNCMKFRTNPSPEIAKEIIASEKRRQQQRLDDARGNDIWVYRNEPPKEWTQPIPGWVEKHEGSLLAEGQKTLDSGSTVPHEKQSSCVIS